MNSAPLRLAGKVSSVGERALVPRGVRRFGRLPSLKLLEQVRIFGWRLKGYFLGYVEIRLSAEICRISDVGSRRVETANAWLDHGAGSLLVATSRLS